MPHAQDGDDATYDVTPSTNPLVRVYQDNPYVVVAAAAGAGYVVAGGLFTPFSRRVLKMGLRAVLAPLVVTQVKAMAQQSLNDL